VHLFTSGFTLRLKEESMNTCFRVVILLLCAGCFTPAFAQDVAVNPQNRTVSVSISDTIQADPEVAVVSIGYKNFGPTREAAYAQNTDMAKKIIAALTSAGVKAEDIETDNATLNRVDDSDKGWTDDQKKERQYEADQEWNIRVPPAQAQHVVDIAIAAGSNNFTGVDWQVIDPLALDAKANALALDKARTLADQMAAKFGAKVGQILYVGNAEQNSYSGAHARGFGNNRMTTVEVDAAAVLPSLTLYSQKVRRDASINVIFALQ
jgi:uncharacterized protein